MNGLKGSMLSFEDISNLKKIIHIPSSGSDPVAGELGGQDENWHPDDPTVVGVASDEPVPDSFSAGAERTT